MKASLLTIREISLFSILGTLIFVMKMVMAPLPNIEPVSFMVLLMAGVYGWKGLWSVYIYAALEFLVWGFGIWSAGYLYVWLILYAAGMVIRSTGSIWLTACVSGIFGLLFGFLFVPVYILTGGLGGALSWWAAGIPFDLMHGAGNFILTLILYRPLQHLLLQLNSHLHL